MTSVSLDAWKMAPRRSRSARNSPALVMLPLCATATRPLLSLLTLPGDDPLIGPLIIAGLEAAGRLAPGCHGVPSAGSLAFAATVRMIHRVHGDAAVVRHLAQPAFPSGLAQRDVLVVHVAHLADRRHAVERHAADFSGRQLQ